MKNVLVGYSQVLEECANLFAKKNAAYGTENISASGLPGIMARMHDKMARLERTASLERASDGETAQDAARDLLNYAAMALLVLRGEWPGCAASVGTSTVISKEQLLVQGDIREPARAGDVGYDLPAHIDTFCPPHQFTRISTGVKVLAPPGKWIMLCGRSSAWAKWGLLVVSGVMDTGYTGEYQIVVMPVGNEPVLVPAGTRLAQAIVLESHVLPMVTADEMPETDRGSAGFGSTG